MKIKTATICVLIKWCVCAFGALTAGCANGGDKAPVCGNGVVEGDEGCDDGAENGQPGKCRYSCVPPICGDLVQDPWEECDDGNNLSGDGCSSTCTHEILCGDGVVEGSEQCDDGNTDAGDGCDGSCRWEYDCGNGVCETDRNETCPLCPDDCCPCGDGICDSAEGEDCTLCAADCCPNCGDGVLDSSEGCDDGNNTDGDGCSAICVDEDGVSECGNELWEAGEQCEDGNTQDGDGCSSTCLTEFVCGDDLCDTDHGETCQLCPGDCCPDCGNGVLDPGEECDGTNVGGQSCLGLCFDGGVLGCTSWCTLDTSSCTGTGPVCGDDVAECGEVCDGDDLQGLTCEGLGYSPGSLGCSASCELDISGCGPLLYYLHEDFEASCPPSGWTLSGDWECGAPTSGPGSAGEGMNSLATNLDGFYSSDLSWGACVADTPEIHLSAATDPLLIFLGWVYTEGSIYDGVNVWVSTDGGQTFSVLAGVNPAYNITVDGESAWGNLFTPGDWEVFTANLSSYVGETIILRFALSSDTSLNYDGFYVDDVWVGESNQIPVDITTTSPLPDASTGTPYTTTLSATGGSGAYTWSLTGGSNYSWLSLDSGTGALTGTPDATHVGPVSLDVRVEDTNNPANFTIKTMTLNVIDEIFSEDFESGCTGWYLANDWECGVPTSGPSSAHGGTSCLATVLGGDYSNSDSYATTVADLPSIPFSSSGSPSMEFYMWVYTEGSSYDGGNLKISTDGGSTFSVVETVDPPYTLTVNGEPAWGGNLSSSGWVRHSVDLSAYAGQTAILRFSFRSDFSMAYPGLYIDDLMVLE